MTSVGMIREDREVGQRPICAPFKQRRRMWAIGALVRLTDRKTTASRLFSLKHSWSAPACCIARSAFSGTLVFALPAFAKPRNFRPCACDVELPLSLSSFARQWATLRAPCVSCGRGRRVNAAHDDSRDRNHNLRRERERNSVREALRRLQVAASPSKSGGSMRLSEAAEPGSLRVTIGTSVAGVTETIASTTYSPSRLDLCCGACSRGTRRGARMQRLGAFFCYFAKRRADAFRASVPSRAK